VSCPSLVSPTPFTLPSTTLAPSFSSTRSATLAPPPDPTVRPEREAALVEVAWAVPVVPVDPEVVPVDRTVAAR
jgi:hypothetical protein